MKKLLFLSISILTMLAFASCSSDDDEAPALGANVQVTVKNLLGTPQKGTTVYMYKDKAIDDNTESANADRQVVTDENGVATFKLNFTELNILESQTSLYFAVFYTIGDTEGVKGTAAVTVKRNDVKQVELQIPI
ncbi:hypothetical protein [Dysgonomonas sp. ZJ709]|uniref:hypothetical protein n=1 Tax=Dysgonomonas sp. ZJ709 TaxID=2709797 RepID=UPI0013EDE628|nr:hypothetical protein [Dysgonomonas sp. ZJ709]